MALPPPLPPELIAFAQKGVSILVGTCSADNVPACSRGMGVRVWPGGARLTLLLPAATSAVSIANLRGNPRLAVTLSHIPSHETIQIKGAVLAVRAGDDADRELARTYRAAFSQALAHVGLHPSRGLRLAIWPCHAVDLEIGVVYTQTPGPRAGERMPLGAP